MVEVKRQLWPALMFAGILASYLLLLTTNYYWDGIFFAQTIEDAPSLNATLLHPNHLIYNLLGYIVFRFSRVVGLSARAVDVLQITNCVISVASAYVLLKILRLCLKSEYLSVAFTLLFAFSATWWKFSTDADSYIASVFFLLISFYLILPSRKPRPYLLALSFSLSMLFHQLAIFFFPVAVLGLLMQTAGEIGNRRGTIVLKFSLAAFVLTFPAFYISFYLVTGHWAFKPFLQWITTFSPENGFAFNAWNNLAYTLRGHSRLFVGGRIAFLRELYSPLMIGLVGFLSVIAAIFFYRLVRHYDELKAATVLSVREDKSFRSLRILCCVWIGCYLLFLFFFIPQNTFYRLFYLPGIVVLLGTLLAPFEHSKGRVRRYRVALFVALVIIANFTFSAYPYSLVSTNPPLALALRLNRTWTPGTLVYFSTWNTDNGLVRYFNPMVKWIEAKREQVDREMRDPASTEKQAWIDTTLIRALEQSPEGGSWLENHTARVPDYDLNNNKYRLQFFRLRPETFSRPAED